MEITINTKEESAESLRQLAQYLNMIADAREGKRRNPDIFGSQQSPSLDNSSGSSPSTGMFSMFDSNQSQPQSNLSGQSSRQHLGQQPNSPSAKEDSKDEDEEITFDINDFIY